MAFGYVYIMNNGNEYKIGLTGSEPEKRRAVLNTASASRVDLVGYVLCKDMEELEAKLHREFMHNRKNGEWFDMNDSDLSKVLEIFKKESINDDMSMFPSFKNVEVKKLSLSGLIRASQKENERREDDTRERKKVEFHEERCEILMTVDIVRAIYFDEGSLYEPIWTEVYSEESKKLKGIINKTKYFFKNGESSHGLDSAVAYQLDTENLLTFEQSQEVLRLHALFRTLNFKSRYWHLDTAQEAIDRKKHENELYRKFDVIPKESEKDKS